MSSVEIPPRVRTIGVRAIDGAQHQLREPQAGEITGIVNKLKEVIKGLAPVEAITSANCLADSLMTFKSHLTHALS